VDRVAQELIPLRDRLGRLDKEILAAEMWALTELAAAAVQAEQELITLELLAARVELEQLILIMLLQLAQV
jgi:hypothetical protein